MSKSIQMPFFLYKKSISKKTILALGAESVGNFSIYKNGKIYVFKNFGDLLNEKNFKKFKKTILHFLQQQGEALSLQIVLTDLHPEMKTTLWGAQLAKKFSTPNKKVKHIQIQHHYAHIFSQVRKNSIPNSKFTTHNSSYGIALDGTGYGLDGKIWGGECFAIEKLKMGNGKWEKQNNQTISTHYQLQRIGHLENQTMLGGDLAIREPARMLITILDKFLDKNTVYSHLSQFYSKNQFELLYNQLQQKFNCQETSSTGRILDAVAVLLGFAKNERLYKHQATDLLEKNSTKPYLNLKAKIRKITNSGRTSPVASSVIYELSTTHLFKYLIKNLHRDKHRLAATAQLYIAQGLHKIIKKQQAIRSKKQYSKNNTQKTINSSTSILRSIEVEETIGGNFQNNNVNIILSGGISNNKIISNYFQSQGILANKKSGIARGDAGLSYGQIICFLQKSVSKKIFRT